ncbi:MAG TPA: hypothetical protein QF753_13120 [Victivallales bacterium]|nr:hypothetical protein [Victivallales bacterium]
MKQTGRVMLIIGTLIFTFIFTKTFAENNKLPITGVTALEKAHAHNDYDHTVPLFDALDHGFTRIEPDVFILYKDPGTGEVINDKLKHFNESGQTDISNYIIMVGHNYGEYKGTLYELYIKPLEQLKSGQFVFEGYNKPILYMIDMKTNYPGSVEFMNTYLAQYKTLFNNYNSNIMDKPVNVILSGYNGGDFRESDYNYLLSVQNRYIGIDGRVDKPLFGQNKSPELFPLISNSWDNRTDEEFYKDIKEAHADGHQIRFWGIDDNLSTWEKLYDAGMDVISTDNLQGVEDFLLSKMTKK